MAVRIPTYERHVNLDAAAQTIPRFHANDEVGKGLSKAGDAMIQVAAHWRKRQEQFENFQMGQRESQARLAIQAIIAEETANYDPGRDRPGLLHERIMARVPGVLAPLEAAAPDRLKKWYAERGVTLSDQASNGAANNESKIGVNYYTGQLDKLTGSLAGSVVVNPDGFPDAVKQMTHSVDGAVNIPSAQRRMMIQGYTKALADKAVEGYTAQGRFDDARKFTDGLRDLQEKDTAPAPSPAVSGKTSGRLDPEKAASIATAADKLGVDPKHLAAVISYETGGSFDPNKWGGKGGNYLGLIQFGPSERKQFGVRQGMTFDEQMPSVVGYLKERGLKPGMGLAEMYSIINAGSLNKNGQPRWGASDGNGTVATHVDKITRDHLTRVEPAFAPPAAPKVVVDPATGKMVMSKDGAPAAPPTVVADASGQIIGGVKVSSSDAFDVTPTANRIPTAPKAVTTWGSWADTAHAMIDGLQIKSEAKDTSMRTKLKSVLASDIASIQATGKPVALDRELAAYFGTDRLNHELVSQRLGEGVALSWEEDRQTAQRVNGAVAGMESAPLSVIQQNLDLVAPTPGAPDFVRQQKVYDMASKMASGILKTRFADPAAAADQLPEVKALLDKVHANPADVEAARALTEARMKAQEYLEVPDGARTPITRSEAAQIAAPLLDRANPNPELAATTIVQSVRAITGGNADMARRALSTVLEAKEISKDQATDIAQSLERAGRPPADPAPDPAAAKRNAPVPRMDYDLSMAFGGVSVGSQAAPEGVSPDSNPYGAAAMAGEFPFIPGQQALPAEHIKMLRQNKGLSSEFDTTYGKGASQWVFENQPGGVGTPEPQPGTDPYAPPEGDE